MGFWSFIGLASKKDYDEVTQKLNDMTLMLDQLTKENQKIYKAFDLVNEQITNEGHRMIENTNDHMNTICERNNKETQAIIEIIHNIENDFSNNNEDIKRRMTLNTKEIKNLYNDVNDKLNTNENQLKKVEDLSTKLLETMKIIWMDNIIDNLNMVARTKKEK
ncbi:hypothetical protein EDC18_1118 [Natranaerovirga pectinivora]|uniref:Uncharacterized protein n=1 Tax=Natranaerovirga pectinivora TaxID=682400 RepID=A0A4R3MHX6_9FIRM|nr:hypothetical protein [Natranaerovirga pectinivora]TCT12837.1 hypothetical protein EDC18_1118 [Natranaerovirga pectinivora]